MDNAKSAHMFSHVNDSSLSTSKKLGFLQWANETYINYHKQNKIKETTPMQCFALTSDRSM